jgi:hypothetical protein
LIRLLAAVGKGHFAKKKRKKKLFEQSQNLRMIFAIEDWAHW